VRVVIFWPPLDPNRFEVRVYGMRWCRDVLAAAM
jgi:hypothetical protein